MEAPSSRAVLLARGRRLAWTTVGWSLFEGALALWLARSAGSVALLGFGLDAIVEAASASVIVWRVNAERGGGDQASIDRLEKRAGRAVAVCLGLLAMYIAIDAALALAARARPETSVAGVGLAAASIVVMAWLSRSKAATARALGSPAMAADAFQSKACLWLGVIVVAGTGLNALFGWWWADPAAALAMTVPVGNEAWKSWRGEHVH